MFRPAPRTTSSGVRCGQQMMTTACVCKGIMSNTIIRLIPSTGSALLVHGWTLGDLHPVLRDAFLSLGRLVDKGIWPEDTSRVTRDKRQMHPQMLHIQHTGTNRQKYMSPGILIQHQGTDPSQWPICWTMLLKNAFAMRRVTNK